MKTYKITTSDAPETITEIQMMALEKMLKTFGVNVNTKVFRYMSFDDAVEFINTIMWNNTATSGMYIWDGTQNITFSYSLINALVLWM